MKRVYLFLLLLAVGGVCICAGAFIKLNDGSGDSTILAGMLLELVAMMGLAFLLANYIFCKKGL